MTSAVYSVLEFAVELAKTLTFTIYQSTNYALVKRRLKPAVIHVVSGQIGKKLKNVKSEIVTSKFDTREPVLIKLAIRLMIVMEILKS